MAIPFLPPCFPLTTLALFVGRIFGIIRGALEAGGAESRQHAPGAMRRVKNWWRSSEGVAARRGSSQKPNVVSASSSGTDSADGGGGGGGAGSQGRLNINGILAAGRAGTVVHGRGAAPVFDPARAGRGGAGAGATTVPTASPAAAVPAGGAGGGAP